MKSQDRRDAQVVTLAVGLMLFLLVAAAGAVALVIVYHFVTLQADLLHVLSWCVGGGGAALSVRYIYRHRDR